MTRRSGIAIAAMLLALAMRATAAPGPSALALAARYLAATGGTLEMIHEQAYFAAATVGNLELSHQRQQAWLSAADRHRAEFDTLDKQVAEVMAETFTADELDAAVRFAESTAGRAINEKREAYYRGIYSPFHRRTELTSEEAASLAAFDATPQALSMKAKLTNLQDRIVMLSLPLQAVLRKDADTIYCHGSRRCTDPDGNDQVAGPSIGGLQ
jgi:hypothetical protein